MFPGHGIVPTASDLLGWSYAKKGQLDEAIQAIEKARQAQPEFTEAVASLGWASALKGDRKTSEAMLAELDKPTKKSWVEPLFLCHHLRGARGQRPRLRRTRQSV